MVTLRPCIQRDIALSLLNAPASEALLCARLNITMDQVVNALYKLRQHEAVHFSGGCYHLTPATRKAIKPNPTKNTPRATAILDAIKRHT